MVLGGRARRECSRLTITRSAARGGHPNADKRMPDKGTNGILVEPFDDFSEVLVALPNTFRHQTYRMRHCFRLQTLHVGRIDLGRWPVGARRVHAPWARQGGLQRRSQASAQICVWTASFDDLPPWLGRHAEQGGASMGIVARGGKFYVVFTVAGAALRLSND